MKKIFLLCVTFGMLSSCSEFALLASGSSIAMSQNVYAKTYSGVDVLTFIQTEKDIKTHIYERIKDRTK